MVYRYQAAALANDTQNVWTGVGLINLEWHGSEHLFFYLFA